MAQVQETLRNFHCLDTFIYEVHGLCPKVETIVRDFLKLEYFPAPPNPVHDRTLVDRIARGGFDEFPPDPVRVPNTANALKLRDPVVRDPEEGQQCPDVFSIERCKYKNNREPSVGEADLILVGGAGENRTHE